MMKPLLFMLSSVFIFEKHEKYEKADFVLRAFPDGETYLKINSVVKQREIIIIDTLDNPNAKIMPLYFLAKTLRDQGAEKITLVAPYLAYMRQDKIFHLGESLTSKYFAELLSSCINRLITIDPHLHRFHQLNELYHCQTVVLHATKVIADYIQKNIKDSVIVGPDGESEQWAREIAGYVNAPMVIAKKTRHSDYNVDVVIEGLENYKNHKPVLVDDIISTAQTMIQTIRYLSQHGFAKPICIGVHAVFAEKAYEDLCAVGPEKIITCNTISHVTNQIDISELIAGVI